MKLKLLLTLGWASVSYAADNAIVLKTDDRQTVVTGLESRNLITNELRMACDLLRFQQQYYVEHLKSFNLQDCQSYEALRLRVAYHNNIEQITILFKQKYPDPSQYEQIFGIANNFHLLSIKQVIAQIMLSPELNLEGLQEHTYSNYTPALRESLGLQLKRRMYLAKERFLWGSDPKIKNKYSFLDIKDPYFKGVSVQDIYDYHGTIRVQRSSPGTLKLNGKFLNSLEGLEKILLGKQLTGEPVHTLDLSDNMLTEIPNNIPGTQTIQKLLLARNKIKDFPDEFTGEFFGWSEFIGWSSLKYLDLQNNDIRYIPSNIRGLGALEALQLSENKIITIPQNLKGLTSLLYLYLSKNGIISIPSRITGLETLYFLDLTYNNIVYVPEDIEGLGLIERLSLVGNPVMNINLSAQGKRKLEVLKETCLVVRSLEKEMIYKLEE